MYQNLRRKLPRGHLRIELKCISRLSAAKTRAATCFFLVKTILKSAKNDKKVVISAIIQYDVMGFDGTIITKRSVCKNNIIATS